MKAVFFNKTGGADVLEFSEKFPMPKISKPNEVLVRVYSTSVNAIDYKLRRGDIPEIAMSYPFVPGSDFSGVVVGTGSDVTTFKRGDEVFGMRGWFGGGTYAEHVLVTEDQLTFKPNKISHNEAASVGLVGLTALQALNTAKLHDKAKVLIHGGSGGVGTLAIQLAKVQYNCYVATTCSTEHVELCKRLGADRVIDYTKEKFDDVLRNFDAVIDTIGGEYAERSKTVLKGTGMLVELNPVDDESKKKYGTLLAAAMSAGKTAFSSIFGELMPSQPNYASLLVMPDSKQLVLLAKLLHDRTIKPVIDKVYSLEEAKEAHSYVETGHGTGKVILEVVPSESYTTPFQYAQQQSAVAAGEENVTKFL